MVWITRYTIVFCPSLDEEITTIFIEMWIFPPMCPLLTDRKYDDGHKYDICRTTKSLRSTLRRKGSIDLEEATLTTSGDISLLTSMTVGIDLPCSNQQSCIKANDGESQLPARAGEILGVDSRPVHGQVTSSPPNLDHFPVVGASYIICQSFTDTYRCTGFVCRQEGV